MQVERVQALLESQFAGCQVEVGGDGRHFDVRVIGELFEGKRKVQRQQLVYAALNDQIASGEIHAVNIDAVTPTEWAAKQG